MKKSGELLASTLILVINCMGLSYDTPKKIKNVTNNGSAIWGVKYQYNGVQPINFSSLCDWSNWQQFIGIDPCDHIGAKLCSIEFDNSNITLSDAIAAIPVSLFYIDGTTYLVPFGTFVTVHTKI